jgi:hypothetical protein
MYYYMYIKYIPHAKKILKIAMHTSMLAPRTLPIGALIPPWSSLPNFSKNPYYNIFSGRNPPQ